MPIDPIKIPQNVYIEDRIVGPLTLRQILICATGGGLSYVMYAALTKSTGGLGLAATIIVWIPAMIAAAFAFVKINDLSLFRIMLLLMERLNKPSVRTFSPRRGIAINIRTFNAPQQQAAASDAKPEHADADELDRVSALLDSNETKRLPVDPTRVSTTPPHSASISLMRDLSPAS